MRFKSFFLVLTFIFLPGIASADLEEGFQAYERGDYEAAVNAWLPLAEQGDVTAQFNLGQMYRLGKGVPRDDLAAVKWYKLAAKQGSPHAQHNLRLMHRDGRANQQDYEEIFGDDDSSVDTITENSVEPLPTETAAPALPPPAPVETAAAPAADQAPIPDTSQPPMAASGVQSSMSMPKNDVAMDSGMDSKMPEPSASDSVVTPPPPAPVQTAMVEKQPAAPVTSGNIGSDGWLQQLNPQDYLVQLIASANRRDLDRFLSANQGAIGSQINIARTLSKGREWHVVLMGPFANRSQANAAINQLPSRIRQNEPWIRQVSSVAAAAR